MSLFRRESESPAVSPTPSRDTATPDRARQNAPRNATHIAPGTKVEGRVSGTTEILVDGELVGDIDVGGRAVVGKEGLVQGRIEARSVRVAGKVVGNVACLERIEIIESGTLEGDVVAPRVVISEGAFFKGKVEMREPGAPRKGGSRSPKKDSAADRSADQGKPAAEKKPEDKP